MSQLADYLKFLLVSYFSKHVYTKPFSHSSESVNSVNFFDVSIYIPNALNDEIKNKPKKARDNISVNFKFKPSQNAARWGWILNGFMKRTDDQKYTDCLLSADHLRYARIDIKYYFMGWIVQEHKCSMFMLIKLFLFKFAGLIYISIIKQKITIYFHDLKMSKRLGTPLRSKLEIYEAIINIDSFLQNGTFKKSELTISLFGTQHVGKFKIHQQVSQSLDWILDSCVEDNEMTRISQNTHSNTLYKVNGKGIHYFTLTKENIKNSESLRNMQEQQIVIQRQMLLLTALLVVVTFIAIDGAKEIFISVVTPVFPYVEIICNKFIWFFT
ncbi:hypothetical protein ACRN9A_16730 [Shewanella frigidimarina]|uniref:hypothetical protein n=1 Tax=Shewanella frigidimarina TaxID=56812 RepID=UPI003D79FEDE